MNRKPFQSNYSRLGLAMLISVTAMTLMTGCSLADIWKLNYFGNWLSSQFSGVGF